MDDDKEKQLLRNAQALLPPSIIENFLPTLKIFVGNFGVYNWNVKLLKFFELTVDKDALTKWLFEYFESCNLILPDEFHFVTKAYKLLDNSNYKRFLNLMLEYVDARCTPENKKRSGREMLEIIRKGASTISIYDSPQKDGVSVKLQAFREFQFWFEMFITLKLSLYKRLVSMVRDYKRALSNENRDERTRKIVMVVFGLDKNLTKKFLDFYSPGTVNQLDSFLSSIRQHYQKPNSMTSDNPSQLSTAMVRQNNPFQNTRTVDYPSQVSTTVVGQNYQFLNSRTAENTSLVSTAMVRQNNPFQNTRTVNYPSQVSTTVVGQNYQFLNSRTAENPSLFSTAMVRQNNPVQNIRTVENTSRWSTVNVGPFVGPSLLSTLPLSSEFSGIILVARQLLDNLNFGQFFNLMLELVDERTSQGNKQIISKRLTKIVRILADNISKNDYPQKDGVSVRFQAFRIFQFWFEMFITLGSSRYMHLVSMVSDYKRAFTNEEKMECTRKIVMVIFGLNKGLTKKFLDFFAPGKVNCLDSFISSVRQHYQKSSSRTSDYPSQPSTSTVGQNYQFSSTRAVGNPSQVSTDGRRNPFLDPWNHLDHTTTVPDTVLMIEPNHQILNTLIEQNYSILDLPTSGMLTPVERKQRDISPQTKVFSMDSAASAEHKIPDHQGAQTADYPLLVPGTPTNFLTENPSPIESSLSDLGFQDPDYLLTITTDTLISNDSIDLFSMFTDSPAESQCLDQETRTADYPLTVPASPIKSPSKNPPPSQSPLPFFV